MWTIKRYASPLWKEWNEFLDKARNSTFLFKREYMDYHSDRFTDCSLMAYRRGRLAAVLPANTNGRRLYSHQGLTYGGWVWIPGLDTNDIFLLWKEWLVFCKGNEIEIIDYKPLPYIYYKMPSDEDRYMLFLSRATLSATDMATVVDLTHNPGFNKLQRRHFAAAFPSVYTEVHDSTNEVAVSGFYSLLGSCLEERHNAIPVHTLDELRLLMQRFPGNILIWGCHEKESGELLAAICVYQTATCVHCQYIASSRKGREMNAMSVLVAEMTSTYTRQSENDKLLRYLDFGTSNLRGGWLLNSGLNRQKTAYGGSGVAYPRYEINVACALESLPTELWPPR